MMTNKENQHSFLINYIIWFYENCLYEKPNNLSLRMEIHVLCTDISMHYTIPWWINSILKRHSKKIIVMHLKTACIDCIWKSKSSLSAAWISSKAHCSEWKDCHWLYCVLGQAMWLEILDHWFQLKMCVVFATQILQQGKNKINQPKAKNVYLFWTCAL